MDALKCLCPACNLIFEAPFAPTVITCPVCDTPISTQVQAPVPAATPPASPALSAGGRSWRGLAALVVIAFLAAGVGLAVQGFFTRPLPSPANVATHPGVVIDESPVETDPIAPTAQPLLPPRLNPQPPSPFPVPPSAPPQAPPQEPQPVPRIRRVAHKRELVPGSLEARVNEAIDRGVAYLRPHMARMKLPCRYEGLAGLTLLECGVPASDPVVQRIAASLRSQVSTLDQTYELSTTIFFLDRLGHKEDAPLIRLLAERLIAGQTESGMWNYVCAISGTAAGQTTDLPWKTARAPGLPGRPWDLDRPNALTGRAIALSPVALLAPPLPGRRGLGGEAGPAGRQRPLYGDHSNTQFALMAVWIAQRHGVPARAALATLGRHFRTSQGADGGWGYYHRGHSTFSNTCAGLLGLAVEQGIDKGLGRRARPRFAPVDPGVPSALGYLGRALPPYVPDGKIHSLHKILNGRGYYALWSMERVGTVYGIERLGSTQWYPWAAQVILNTEDARGGWRGAIDTCFALLVLRRSNLMPDLTEAITGHDPRRPANPPLLTERPKRPRPVESGAAESPKETLPRDGILIRPGTRETLPDERGIVPRPEAKPKSQLN